MDGCMDYTGKTGQGQNSTRVTFFGTLEYGAASFFPCSRNITGLMSLVSARELRLALVLHSMNIFLHSLESRPCLERLLHILLCTYLTQGAKAPLQKMRFSLWDNKFLDFRLGHIYLRT